MPPHTPDLYAVLHKRSDVLRALGSDARPKRDLLDVCDVSRSTIDRAVRDLVAAGLVERRDGHLRRTLVGELALAEHDRYRDRLSGLADATSVLDSLPADAPLDAAVLDGARVVRPDRNAPQGPLADLTSLVERATDVCAIAPAVFPDQVWAYHDRIVDGGATARIALTPDAVQYLLAAFTDPVSEALDTGRLSLRQTDGIPYSLAVAETPTGPEVGLLVYTAGGIRGFVGNVDSDAVAWARDEFDRWWEAADALEPGRGDAAAE